MASVPDVPAETPDAPVPAESVQHEPLLEESVQTSDSSMPPDPSVPRQSAIDRFWSTRLERAAEPVKFNAMEYTEKTMNSADRDDCERRWTIETKHILKILYGWAGEHDSEASVAWKHMPLEQMFDEAERLIDATKTSFQLKNAKDMVRNARDTYFMDMHSHHWKTSDASQTRRTSERHSWSAAIRSGYSNLRAHASRHTTNTHARKPGISTTTPTTYSFESTLAEPSTRSFATSRRHSRTAPTSASMESFLTSFASIGWETNSSDASQIRQPYQKTSRRRYSDSHSFWLAAVHRSSLERGIPRFGSYQHLSTSSPRWRSNNYEKQEFHASITSRSTRSWTASKTDGI